MCFTISRFSFRGSKSSNKIRNLAKTKMQHFGQKLIVPTVLSKPWDCLQYCWSCMRFFNGVEFAWGFLQRCSAFSNPTATRTQFLFLSSVASLPSYVCNAIHQCSCTILTAPGTQSCTHQRLLTTAGHCSSRVQRAVVFSLVHKPAKSCLQGNYFWLFCSHSFWLPKLIIALLQKYVLF